MMRTVPALILALCSFGLTGAGSNDGLKLNVEGVSAAEALSLIADQAGIEIELRGEAPGTVKSSFESLPLLAAVREVLKPRSYLVAGPRIEGDRRILSVIMGDGEGKVTRMLGGGKSAPEDEYEATRTRGAEDTLRRLAVADPDLAREIDLYLAEVPEEESRELLEMLEEGGMAAAKFLIQTRREPGTAP